MTETKAGTEPKIIPFQLRQGEEILYEGVPARDIFLVWFITKIIPFMGIASFYTFCFYLVSWFAVAAVNNGRYRAGFSLYVVDTVLFFMPIWVAVFYLYYLRLLPTLHYYITNYRCVYSGGFFVKRLRNIPLNKITDIEINQNIFDQAFGLYSLKIFTPAAGARTMPGFENAEIIFYGLRDAQEPLNIIQDKIRIHRAEQ